MLRIAPYDWPGCDWLAAWLATGVVLCGDRAGPGGALPAGLDRSTRHGPALHRTAARDLPHGAARRHTVAVRAGSNRASRHISEN